MLRHGLAGDPLRQISRAAATLAAAAVVAATLAAAASAQTISGTEGQQLSGQVASYQTDCSSLLAASGSIDWGDQTGVTPAQIAISGSELAISGSHSYVEEGRYPGTASGSYSCDGRVESFSAGFGVQVADAPLYLAGGRHLAASPSDQSFSGQLATINLAEAPSSYSAVIQWGDGTSSGATITPCAGVFCVGTDAVSGSHQYPAGAGVYTITVTVRDDGGQVASVTDTITVARPAQCPQPSWGGQYARPPYSFSDEFDLSSPQPIVDQNGDPTGQYSQTLWILLGGVAVVTPECWYAVGETGPPATGDAFEPTIHFLTYSGVAINGVYFIPESPDSLLVLGTDGTIVAENLCGLVSIRGVRMSAALGEAADIASVAAPGPPGPHMPARRGDAAACNSSTDYNIEVPENGSGGGPLITVGRVDLRAHPITDFSVSLAAAGSIQPAPGGPRIGTHQINPGATVENLPYPASYAARVSAQIDLPGEFSQIPGNGVAGSGDQPADGQPVTAQLTYDTQGPTLGGGTSGGGGGGLSGSNNPCLGIIGPRPPSCTPVAQLKFDRAGAARGLAIHADSWDPAALAGGAVAAGAAGAGAAADARAAAAAAGGAGAGAAMGGAPAARYAGHRARASGCAPVDLSASQLFLGGLHILNVSLTCDPSTGWTGIGQLDFTELPGGEALPSAAITFHLNPDGSFKDGNASLTFSPAAPVFATPPVALDSLDIAIATHPTDFVGQADIDILGGLVHIDGGVLVANGDCTELAGAGGGGQPASSSSSAIRAASCRLSVIGPAWLARAFMLPSSLVVPAMMM